MGYFGGGLNQNFPKLSLHPKYPALVCFAFLWKFPGSCCSDLTQLSLSLISTVVPPVSAAFRSPSCHLAVLPFRHPGRSFYVSRLPLNSAAAADSPFRRLRLPLLGPYQYTYQCTYQYIYIYIYTLIHLCFGGRAKSRSALRVLYWGARELA